jgi:tetratricopeptide (TPR) repeat protein
MGQKKLALATKSYKEGDLKKAIYILEGTKEKINSHRFVLSFFYFLDKKLEKIRPELLLLVDIDYEDLGFLKQLCILAKDPKLMVDTLSHNSKIKQGEKDLAIGEVFFEVGEYDLAESHYLKAIEAGEVVPYKHLSMISFEKGDDFRAEELMVSGLEQGAVKASDLLEFYEFHF